MATNKFFRKGDIVKWWSQSGGYRKGKEGEVMVVVPYRMNIKQALELLPKDQKFNFSPVRSAYGCRSYESYLIRVGTKIYWPDVTRLTIVERKSNL